MPAPALWVVSDNTSLAIRGNVLKFIGAAGTHAEMYIDSARNTNFRIEAVINRGGDGHGTYGNNLTFQGDSATANASRYEYGCVHVDDQTVTLRYRYAVNGAGAWITIAAAYGWPVNTSMKLIAEVEDDIYTFRIADRFGHDERTLLRVRNTLPNSTSTLVGWALNGNPVVSATIDGDTMDSFRVMNYASLIRIKYKLLPDFEFIEVPLWTGNVLSGNTGLIVDPTKLWDADELTSAFLRILSGPAINSDVPILSNSETAILPATPLFGTPASGDQYLVYDKYFTGTERLTWAGITRQQKTPQILLWHGERIGAPHEIEHRMLIDANHIPELILTMSVVAPADANETFIQCAIEPDDDVSTWRLLLRKGNWPTVGHIDPVSLLTVYSADDPVDLQYTKFTGNTDFRTQVFQVGNGIWYGIAIPYDSNGQPGPVSTASIDTSAGGPQATGPYISIETQPPVSWTNDGTPFNPAPVVRLRDINGQPVLAAGIAIKATDDLNIPPDSLTGTTSVLTDANGVATFSNLGTTNTLSSGSVLRFSAPNYQDGVSNFIALTAIGSNYITVETQPSTVNASGQAMALAPTVQIRDTNSNPILTAGVPITIATDLPGYTVTFTTGGVTDSNGKATWIGLTVTGPASTIETGFPKFVFSSPGFASGFSNTFVIGVPSSVSVTNFQAKFGTFIVSGVTQQKGTLLQWQYPAAYGPNGSQPNAATVDILCADAATGITQWVCKNIHVWNVGVASLSGTTWGSFLYPDIISPFGPSTSLLLGVGIDVGTNPWGIQNPPNHTAIFTLYLKVNGTLQNTITLSFPFFGDFNFF